MVKLAVKPDSIEHIFDIRDWMETIPMSVKSLEETCKRYLLVISSGFLRALRDCGLSVAGV